MALFGNAALSILPKLLGSQQLGSAAPAFNLGDPLQDAGPMGIPPKVTSMPSVFNTDAQNEEMQSGFGDRVGGFFDNLDTNLQSPSKQLGLGLLSQIDPRLAGAGLFAGGLFGQNKVF